MKEFVLPFLLSAATGVLSGWGVGGGTLLLLSLTLFLGVDNSTARIINLLTFLPAAGLSLWFHRKHGRIDTALLVRTILPGIAAALLAALVSTAVDASLLRKPFGLFLLYCGLSMLRGARKR